MSCIGSAILKTVLKVFGKTYTVEEVSEYADFYWKFMEVETTASEDLPGFNHYHNMLRNFIRKHDDQFAIDNKNDNVQKVEDYDEIYEYTKVMRWLSNETYKTNNEFTDIQTWLEHQSNESDSKDDDNVSSNDTEMTNETNNGSIKEDLKYLYSQVHGTFQRECHGSIISSNESECSIYNTSAPWEVTRKPTRPATKYSTETVKVSNYQDSIWV